MLWIKRNLFLAIIGLVSLVSLGAGTFYLYSSVQKNKQLEESLEAQKKELLRLYSIDPFPDRTNIVLLKAEVGKIKTSVDKSKNYFSPVPYEKLTGLEFKAKLDDTVADLRKRAVQQSVKLSDNFAFSFKEEQKALTLSPTMFPTLPAQLAEVEAICNILFDAKINQLESIRRPHITGGEQGMTDHHEAPVSTNTEVKLLTTPYEFTFFTFSPELAKIMEHCYRTNHGFIVKTVSLDTINPEKRTRATNTVRAFQPVPPANRTAGARQPGAPQPIRPPPGQPNTTPPAVVQKRPQPPGRGGPPEKLETVIDEKLLKVTLWVYVVRPVT